MSDTDKDGATNPTLRLVMLIVAGLVIANAVAARRREIAFDPTPPEPIVGLTP